jgi:hypothetical protein
VVLRRRQPTAHQGVAEHPMPRPSRIAFVAVPGIPPAGPRIAHERLADLDLPARVLSRRTRQLLDERYGGAVPAFLGETIAAGITTRARGDHTGRGDAHGFEEADGGRSVFHHVHQQVVVEGRHGRGNGRRFDVTEERVQVPARRVQLGEKCHADSQSVTPDIEEIYDTICG